MQFLRGLNDQYNNVKSHVLLMEPLPPISKIFSYVVQQERQLLGQNFIANVHLDRTSSVNVVASPTCTHCNRTGHTDAVCFRKHGFPSTINRSNRGSSNRPQRICNHCGKTGHTIEVCYQKHGLPPGSKPLSDKTASVNHTVTGDCKVTKSTQSLESQDVRFTPQQYQALLALIQQSTIGTSASVSPCVNQIGSISSSFTKPSSSSGTSFPIVCSVISTPSSWILDSGATDHVSGTRFLIKKPPKVFSFGAAVPNTNY
uniref:CCHC-type domain-containing protein n=1 Tax=Cajanus cajan TaxID=3821 RepID=A0A151T2L4_CAJCA|nr:hypothetical protein KK1_023726 [Cajanus cajan]